MYVRSATSVVSVGSDTPSIVQEIKPRMMYVEGASGTKKEKRAYDDEIRRTVCALGHRS